MNLLVALICMGLRMGSYPVWQNTVLLFVKLLVNFVKSTNLKTLGCFPPVYVSENLLMMWTNMDKHCCTTLKQTHDLSLFKKNYSLRPENLAALDYHNAIWDHSLHRYCMKSCSKMKENDLFICFGQQQCRQQ